MMLDKNRAAQVQSQMEARIGEDFTDLDEEMEARLTNLDQEISHFMDSKRFKRSFRAAHVPVDDINETIRHLRIKSIIGEREQSTHVARMRLSEVIEMVRPADSSKTSAAVLTTVMRVILFSRFFLSILTSIEDLENIKRVWIRVNDVINTQVEIRGSDRCVVPGALTPPPAIDLSISLCYTSTLREETLKMAVSKLWETPKPLTGDVSDMSVIPNSTGTLWDGWIWLYKSWLIDQEKCDTFTTWGWDRKSSISSLLSIEPMLDICSSKKKDWDQRGAKVRAGWDDDIVVDIACVCRFLSPEKCAESGFCVYDWDIEICYLSYFQVFTEIDLSSRGLGYRRRNSPVECTYDDMTANECDIIDYVASNQLLVEGEKDQVNGGCGGLSFLFVIYLLMIVGDQYRTKGVTVVMKFLSLLTAVAALCVIVNSYALSSTFSLSAMYPQIPYLDEFPFVYRFNSKFIDENLQNFISLDRSIAKNIYGPGDYVPRLQQCNPGTGQMNRPSIMEWSSSSLLNPPSSQSKWLMTWFDFNFQAALLTVAFLSSNIGTGSHVHHGSLTGNEIGVPSLAIRQGVTNSIFSAATQTFLYNTILSSLMQLGTNTYTINKTAAFNQLWYLEVPSAERFHPYLAFFWSSMIPSVVLACFSTYVCSEVRTEGAGSTLAMCLLITKFIVDVCEAHGYAQHIVVLLNKSLDKWYVLRSGLPAKKGITPGSLTLWMTKLILGGISLVWLSNGLDGFYRYTWIHWLIFMITRCLIPAYLIQLSLMFTWDLHRELTAMVIGTETLRIQESVYWLGLVLLFAVPLMTDTNECLDGFYTCQANMAFPSIDKTGYKHDTPFISMIDVLGFYISQAMMCSTMHWVRYMMILLFIISNIALTVVLIIYQAFKFKTLHHWNNISENKYRQQLDHNFLLDYVTNNATCTSEEWEKLRKFKVSSCGCVAANLRKRKEGQKTKLDLKVATESNESEDAESGLPTKRVSLESDSQEQEVESFMKSAQFDQLVKGRLQAIGGSAVEEYFAVLEKTFVENEPTNPSHDLHRFVEDGSFSQVVESFRHSCYRSNLSAQHQLRNPDVDTASSSSFSVFDETTGTSSRAGSSLSAETTSSTDDDDDQNKFVCSFHQDNVKCEPIVNFSIKQNIWWLTVAQARMGLMNCDLSRGHSDSAFILNSGELGCSKVVMDVDTYTYLVLMEWLNKYTVLGAFLKWVVPVIATFMLQQGVRQLQQFDCRWLPDAVANEITIVNEPLLAVLFASSASIIFAAIFFIAENQSIQRYLGHVKQDENLEKIKPKRISPKSSQKKL
eukprot:GHVH01004415.1.p1 GENE.GHVH01004415.1~~GHVH01004415.1.p1  ORF type:complete len:1297 (+),score=153.41 GHVH01004415.1:1605-5495(+)